MPSTAGTIPALQAQHSNIGSIATQGKAHADSRELSSRFTHRRPFTRSQAVPRPRYRAERSVLAAQSTGGHFVLKAALFIDFDNFFGGLLAADPDSAMAVVQRPSVWLARLTHMHSEQGRRWLVLRSYMNPAGSVPHPNPRSPGDRLFFSTFRPFFTRAGFEVVDCPALTKGAKNGADIRIAIDVMQALSASTRYDEFVIASRDADFTPLLQVVRADDRRITVIATGSTAPAYEALADRYLDEQDIVDLMRPPEEIDDTEDVAQPADPVAAQVGRPAENPADDDSLRRAFEQRIRTAYRDADEPLNLARLSSELAAELGPRAKASRWFGAGTFLRAVMRLGLPELAFSEHHLWDATRHTAPPSRHGADVPGEALARPVPPAVSAFCEITKLPRLGSDDWPAVYRLLAEYAARGVFSLVESTSWPRDRAAELGLQIPGSAFSYTVRACLHGGAPLNSDPPPGQSQIARALFASVRAQAELTGLEPSSADLDELAAWLHAPPLDDAQPAIEDDDRSG